MLIIALIGEKLCIDYFEFSLSIFGDAPRVEVEKDLFLVAKFMYEIEDGFCEIEPVVIGECMIYLFKKAIFCYFEYENSIVFFLNLNFFDGDILCKFIVFSLFEYFPVLYVVYFSC